jgi:hypothetical protein
VQVEGTIKVGSCHPWVHQGSGRLMCGDRYQEPSSLKEARAGTVNDCMFSHSSHGARKATFILVEQRRSMQRRSSQWRVGRKRCCTRSRSESHSRNQRRRGARQLFAAARTPPPRCSNSRQLIGEALPQSTALVGATPGSHGSRSMLMAQGPNLDRHPPQPCILPNSQPLFAFGRKARGHW